MSAPVYDRDDDHGVRMNAVVDRVRETTDEHAPKIAIMDGVGQWRFRDVGHRCVDGVAELSAQAGALTVVPGERVEGVRLRLCCEDDLGHDYGVVIFARTCAQGVPAGPSRSSRARRRSSSARVSGVRAMSSGDRLCQSSSISSNFSSGLSVDKSMAGLLTREVCRFAVDRARSGR